MRFRIIGSLATILLAAASILFLPQKPAQAQLATVVASCPPTRAVPYPVGVTALLTIDQNGVLCTNATGGGGGASSTFGAAFPVTGTAVGMSQGGNMVAFTGTANNLNVQCANCSGSGVSTVDEAAFVAATSLFAGSGGFFQTTATSNALTNGQQGMFQVTANRALFNNLRNAAGAEVGVAAVPLQVSLANTGANGTALLVTGAAGTFPATAASGSIAAGAMVDLLTMRQTVAAGTVAANSLLAGGQYRSTPITLTDAQGSALQLDANGYVKVNVTNTCAAGSGQQAMSGSCPVVLASNQTVADPCMFAAKSNFTISQTAGAQIITGTSSLKTYICSIAVIGADAEGLSVIARTGSVCATGSSTVFGGTTGTLGPNFAANGGMTYGNGTGTVMAALGTAADNVCLLQSASGRVAGGGTYVQR